MELTWRWFPVDGEWNCTGDDEESLCQPFHSSVACGQVTPPLPPALWVLLCVSSLVSWVRSFLPVCLFLMHFFQSHASDILCLSWQRVNQYSPGQPLNSTLPTHAPSPAADPVLQGTCTIYLAPTLLSFSHKFGHLCGL